MVHGNLYGTSFEAVRRVSESGRICILDIDAQVCACIGGKAARATSRPC